MHGLCPDCGRQMTGFTMLFCPHCVGRASVAAPPVSVEHYYILSIEPETKTAIHLTTHILFETPGDARDYRGRGSKVKIFSVERNRVEGHTKEVPQICIEGAAKRNPPTVIKLGTLMIKKRMGYHTLVEYVETL